MERSIKGSDRKIKVDARYAKMLPASLWMNTTREGKEVPTCRYNGKTCTVVRAIGLIAGFPPCQFLLPRNGDHFDCRIGNVTAEMPVPPKRVYARSKTGVTGIRPKGKGFVVIVNVNGREKYLGTAANLDAARALLTNAL